MLRSRAGHKWAAAIGGPPRRAGAALGNNKREGWSWVVQCASVWCWLRPLQPGVPARPVIGVRRPALVVQRSAVVIQRRIAERRGGAARVRTGAASVPSPRGAARTAAAWPPRWRQRHFFHACAPARARHDRSSQAPRNDNRTRAAQGTPFFSILNVTPPQLVIKTPHNVSPPGPGALCRAVREGHTQSLLKRCEQMQPRSPKALRPPPRATRRAAGGQGRLQSKVVAVSSRPRPSQHAKAGTTAPRQRMCVFDGVRNPLDVLPPGPKVQVPVIYKRQGQVMKSPRKDYKWAGEPQSRPQP